MSAPPAPGPAATPRRGRRPAGQDSRAAILAAARAEFAEHGFEASSLRSVARRAGVDPGTVRHWFGDKAHLLTAALGVADLDPGAVVREVLAGPPETLGERLVLAMVRLWDTDDGATVRVVMPAVVADPALRALLPQFLGAEVFGPVARTLDVDDVALRVSLAASQMAGLLLTRHLVRVDPLASRPPEEVAALVGPTVQRYLTGALPPR